MLDLLLVASSSRVGESTGGDAGRGQLRDRLIETALGEMPTQLLIDPIVRGVAALA